MSHSRTPKLYCVAYHDHTADVTMIDTFRAGKVPQYAFQTPLPAADVSLRLPDYLHAFEVLYSYLDTIGLAECFPKSYITFSLMLNHLLGVPVLSLISDDDLFDFACTVNAGRLTRIRCRCEDLLISNRDGQPHIQPLISECEDEEFLTDLAALKSAVPAATIADRNVERDNHLRAIAEWRNFSGRQSPILGLGSFHPPEDEAEWELVVGP